MRGQDLQAFDGGRRRRRDRVDRPYLPELFLLGVTAAHPQHGLSTGDVEEAAVKRFIAGRSAETYVTLTADKLDKVSPAGVLGLDAVAGLIVAADMPEARMAPYREAGAAVIRA